MMVCMIACHFHLILYPFSTLCFPCTSTLFVYHGYHETYSLVWCVVYSIVKFILVWNSSWIMCTLKVMDLANRWSQPTEFFREGNTKTDVCWRGKIVRSGFKKNRCWMTFCFIIGKQNSHLNASILALFQWQGQEIRRKHIMLASCYGPWEFSQMQKRELFISNRLNRCFWS